MKTSPLLLCIFLFLNTVISAQSYHDWPSDGWKQTMYSKTWNGSFNQTAVLDLNYVGDTLIQGSTYKAISLFGGNTYLRLQNGKVFLGQINSTWQEIKLFDFSLEVGDPVADFYFTPSDYIVTKKEKVLSPNNDSLIVMELMNSGTFPNTITWMEGVGDLRTGIVPFVGPDGSLDHICTLNKNNQTIKEVSVFNSSCNCDDIHGTDNDNDGHRNHLPDFREIKIQYTPGLPVFRFSEKAKTCDTLIISSALPGELLFYDQENGGNLVTPDLVQNDIYSFYNLFGLTNLIVSSNEFGVVYDIGITGCLLNDCDDDNADVNYDQMEQPYNGVDDDCNISTPDDDLDMDGFLLADDCNDEDPAINPEADEIPDNNIDENCDGVDGSVSIENIAFEELLIFPNPTSQFINITGLRTKAWTYEIYNPTGRIAKSDKFKNQIDLNGLPSGIYLIKITNSHTGAYHSSQIVKQ